MFNANCYFWGEYAFASCVDHMGSLSTEVDYITAASRQGFPGDTEQNKSLMAF